jgi:hypothetical protein
MEESGAGNDFRVGDRVANPVEIYLFISRGCRFRIIDSEGTIWVIWRM